MDHPPTPPGPRTCAQAAWSSAPSPIIAPPHRSATPRAFSGSPTPASTGYYDPLCDARTIPTRLTLFTSTLRRRTNNRLLCCSPTLLTLMPWQTQQRMSWAQLVLRAQPPVMSQLVLRALPPRQTLLMPRSPPISPSPLRSMTLLWPLSYPTSSPLWWRILLRSTHA
jgi:hypothetical protein